jgi:hypothetical protein
MYTNEFEETVTNQVVSTSNKLAAHGLQDVYAFSRDFYNAISGLTSSASNKLTELYALKEQKAFHDSLSIIEKYVPFLSKGKQERFSQTLELRANVLNTALQLGGMAVVWVLENRVIENAIARNRLKTGLLSLAANVNHIQGNESSTVQQYKISSILREQNIKATEKELESAFSRTTWEEYPVELNRYPDFKLFYAGQLVNLLDVDECNTDEPRKRLYEFLSSHMLLSNDDIDGLIEGRLVLYSGQRALIDQAHFTATHMLGDILSKLVNPNNLVDAIVANDPYRKNREIVGKGIEKAATGIALGMLTLATGPIGDMILVGAGGIVLNSIKKIDPDLASEAKRHYISQMQKKDKTQLNKK